jgi:hypothetical protein
VPPLAQLDEIWAAVPQRLPATTPLDHVVLRDHQVWIRTRDGTLYLAPEDGDGLTWGYRGNGPTTLAKLLNRLLDDVNAPAVSSLQEEGAVPRGLQAQSEAGEDDGPSHRVAFAQLTEWFTSTDQPQNEPARDAVQELRVLLRP